ncbi:MAG: helix-turn-helix domain-containing protein [Zoogloeaceae bacterium]|jgi:Ner family transcriptional regulator|nr:helix-turn-helix domain-containing protein [Zoogloeaceae bacterium]
MNANITPCLLTMHPADVVAALRKRGMSLRRLSVAHGYAPTTLGVALHRRWPKGQKIIADALGLDGGNVF